MPPASKHIHRYSAPKSPSPEHKSAQRRRRSYILFDINSQAPSAAMSGRSASDVPRRSLRTSTRTVSATASAHGMRLFQNPTLGRGPWQHMATYNAERGQFESLPGVTHLYADQDGFPYSGTSMPDCQPACECYRCAAQDLVVNEAFYRYVDAMQGRMTEVPGLSAATGGTGSNGRSRAPRS